MLNLNFQVRFLTSLLLTAFFSFITPAIFVLSLWLGLSIVGQLVPPLSPFSNGGIDQLKNFLFVFGSGELWQAFIVMGTTGAVVGILFDTYALSLSRSNR
jgi:hypothetical protein